MNGENWLLRDRRESKNEKQGKEERNEMTRAGIRLVVM